MSIRNIEFRSRIHKFLRLGKRFIVDLNENRVIQVLTSAATMLPTVLIETFMTVEFGYTAEMFKSKFSATELRNKAVSMMQSEGTFNVDSTLLRQATKDALQILGVHRGQFVPVDLKTAASSLPSNTSTGPWDFGRPKSVYFDKTVELCQLLLEHAHSLNEYDIISQLAATYIAWRTQERLSGTKFRQIYLLPYYFNILEATFAVPLFEHYYLNRSTGYCFDTVWPDLQNIWNNLQNGKQIFALDWSDFDLSQSRAMIIHALITIKSLFRLDPHQSKVFDQIITVHSSVTVFTSRDGKPYAFNKKSGVLSGSVFTNYLDTVINVIAFCYVLRKRGYNPVLEYAKFKGDDIISTNNQGFDLNLFRSDLIEHFGAIIKDDAIKVFKKGDKVEFLGYLFDNKEKVALSDELLDRKIAVSGRFIPEDEMPENIRVISKVVSVLSNVSNGYEIFMTKYYNRLLKYYNLSSMPDYYYDLTDNELQSYSTKRQSRLWYNLRYGWQFK